MSERQLNVKQPESRPKRQRVGSRDWLSIPNQDPNYVYRIVAVDTERRVNRVDHLIDAGYEVVPGVSIGDSRADIGKGIGRTGVISLGSGATGVPMRIKKEFYEEDQAAKQKEIDARCADIAATLEPERGSKR